MALKETVGKPDLSLIPLTFFQNLNYVLLDAEDDMYETPFDVLINLHSILARKNEDFESIRDSLILLYFRTHPDQDSTSHKFADLLKAMALVMEYGLTKYSRENWALGGSVIKLLTACERHILTWSYDELDKDSGQSHIAHALCNISFLMYYQSHPDLWQLNDDRTFIYISNN